MRFWLTTAVILLLDRFSKIWIMNNVDLGSGWIVINGILNISYIQNRGAAFGILQGQAWLFLTLAAIVVVAVVYYNRKYNLPGWIQYALALIAGGTLGNLIDRLLYRSVVDFISIGWFPVFNVADMAIVGGGTLFMLYVIKNDLSESGRK